MILLITLIYFTRSPSAIARAYAHAAITRDTRVGTCNRGVIVGKQM